MGIMSTLKIGYKDNKRYAIMTILLYGYNVKDKGMVTILDMVIMIILLYGTMLSIWV